MSIENDADRLAGPSLAAGDATGWFDRLYREAADGRATVPWDAPTPSGGLDSAGLGRGDGRRALVVGCGLGRDAEFVAGLGYATTAFDISPTAVRAAAARHPGSPVDSRVADLLEPPSEWAGAWDLVVESNTVQALPRSLRPRATAAVASFVAPGGTLLVLAAAVDSPSGSAPDSPAADSSSPAAVDSPSGAALDSSAAAAADCWPPAAPDSPSGAAPELPAEDGLPWPLTAGEVAAFAGGGLREVSVERLPSERFDGRWRALFTRPST
jgi:SAM-dependent methyltransferase